MYLQCDRCQFHALECINPRPSDDSGRVACRRCRSKKTKCTIVTTRSRSVADRDSGETASPNRSLIDEVRGVVFPSEPQIPSNDFPSGEDSGSETCDSSRLDSEAHASYVAELISAVRYGTPTPRPPISFAAKLAGADGYVTPYQSTGKTRSIVNVDVTGPTPLFSVDSETTGVRGGDGGGTLGRVSGGALGPAIELSTGVGSSLIRGAVVSSGAPVTGPGSGWEERLSVLECLVAAQQDAIEKLCGKLSSLGISSGDSGETPRVPALVARALRVAADHVAESLE